MDDNQVFDIENMKWQLIKAGTHKLMAQGASSHPSTPDSTLSKRLSNSLNKSALKKVADINHSSITHYKST